MGRIAALLLSMGACLWLPHSAQAAEPGAEEVEMRRLRAELWGGDTFDGRGTWLHDAYVVHAVEYEFLLFAHVSMGLRALPALLYFDAELIVGAGLGMTHRVYWERDCEGLYAGPQVAIIGHHGRFEGNSARVNIMSSLEIGYQLPDAPFRIAVKLEHVSNANLAARNRGWNGLAILFGMSLYER